VSAQLLETRQKINAAKTKLLVADDQLNRLEIKAPRSGTVQGSRACGSGVHGLAIGRHAAWFIQGLIRPGGHFACSGQNMGNMS
jgi:hypothetical protein